MGVSSTRSSTSSASDSLASKASSSHQVAGAANSQRVVSGDGALLIREQGEPLIDAISSWWVTLHGHAHPVQRPWAEGSAADVTVLSRFCGDGAAVHPAHQLHLDVGEQHQNPNAES